MIESKNISQTLSVNWGIEHEQSAIEAYSKASEISVKKMWILYRRMPTLFGGFSSWNIGKW